MSIVILAFCLTFSSQIAGQRSLPDAVPTVRVLSVDKSVLTVALTPIRAGDGLKPLPVRLVGRTAINSASGAVEHEWPGFYAEAHFQGETIILRVDDATNRLRITIDDGATGIIEVSQVGRTEISISGLRRVKHSILFEKINESSRPASFGGFFVPSVEDILPPPPRPARLIEFIGDSDTVGYGNMSNIRECSADQVFIATDVTNSFGPRIAARFKGDYRMLARSGIGLIRNYGGAGGETMTMLHDRIIPSAPQKPNSPEVEADLIVIGIGANDVSPSLEPDEKPSDFEAAQLSFEQALLALGRARLQQNPGAAIIMLAFGEYGVELTSAYRHVTARLHEEGVEANLVVLPKLSRRSCDWHPSQADHTLIATLLEHAILQTLPEWAN